MYKYTVLSATMLLLVTPTAYAINQCQSSQLQSHTLEVVKDSYVSSGRPDTNYGQTVALRASSGFDPSPHTGTKRTLLSFDLTQLPNNAVIESAYLRFYQADSTRVDGLHVFPVISSWDEHLVTWNTQPSIGQLLGHVESRTGYVTFSNNNLLNLVKDWQSQTVSNHGFEIQVEKEHANQSNSGRRGDTIRSREEGNPNTIAKLDISYRETINSSAIDTSSLKDLNANGYPEIVLLATDSLGQIHTCINDMGDGTSLNSVPFFDNSWEGIAVSSELSTNQQPLISVAAKNVATGQTAVEVRDANTGQLVNQIFY